MRNRVGDVNGRPRPNLNAVNAVGTDDSTAADSPQPDRDGTPVRTSAETLTGTPIRAERLSAHPRSLYADGSSNENIIGVQGLDSEDDGSDSEEDLGDSKYNLLENNSDDELEENNKNTTDLTAASNGQGYIDRLSEVVEELSDTKQSLEKAEKIISEKESTIKEKEESFKEFSLRAVEEEQAHQKTKVKLEAINKALDETNKKNEALKAVSVQAEEKVNEITKALEEKEAMLEVTKEDLETAEENLLTEQKAHKETKAELKATNKALEEEKNKVGNLEKALEGKKADLEATNKALDEANKKARVDYLSDVDLVDSPREKGNRLWKFISDDVPSAVCNNPKKSGVAAVAVLAGIGVWIAGRGNIFEGAKIVCNTSLMQGIIDFMKNIDVSSYLAVKGM